MSTYGLAIIADLPDEPTAHQLLTQLTTTLTPDDDPDHAITPHPDYGTRLIINAPGLVANHQEHDIFTGLPAGRAIVCEDGDEYGVTFSAWQFHNGTPTCIYNAYVDAGDRDPDTAARTLTGTTAATTLAALYNTNPQPLLDLETDPTPIQEEIGIIASPFLPWLHALHLDWPQP